ncbi:MAG: FAD-dependent oxidoreductase [Saprospiraceae bacterium]|nr:FAD-dependent oxidoreductase [Saprospiraceae bacterium]
MSNTFSPATTNDHPADERFLPALPPGSSIAVVGAGAFGGWSALFLLRHGYQVTLIDQWGPGNTRASSGGESRLIRCIYGDNLFYTRLAAEAYDLWEEEQEKFSQQVLFPTGSLWFVDQDNQATMQSSLRHLEACGLKVRPMSTRDCLQRYPIISTEGLAEVLYEQRTGYLLARVACAEVVNRFVTEGGIYKAAKARPHIEGSSCKVKLHDGSLLEIDGVLFATGPWMKELFPDVLHDALSITRQEVYYFGVKPELQQEVSELPTWIDHSPPHHFYGVPDSLRRGFKIAFDGRGEEVDPSSMDRMPSAENVAIARHYIQERFPALGGGPLLEARICQYSNTIDANLFLRSHPECENLYLLGGGSGHGFKHGPALGKLVSQCLSGRLSVPHQLAGI